MWRRTNHSRVIFLTTLLPSRFLFLQDTDDAAQTLGIKLTHIVLCCALVDIWPNCRLETSTQRPLTTLSTAVSDFSPKKMRRLHTQGTWLGVIHHCLCRITQLVYQCMMCQIQSKHLNELKLTSNHTLVSGPVSYQRFKCYFTLNEFHLIEWFVIHILTIVCSFVQSHHAG